MTYQVKLRPRKVKFDLKNKSKKKKKKNWRRQQNKGLLPRLPNDARWLIGAVQCVIGVAKWHSVSFVPKIKKNLRNTHNFLHTPPKTASDAPWNFAWRRCATILLVGQFSTRIENAHSQRNVNIALYK